MSGRLHIRPRYHRWHVDPGVEWVESNTTHDHLDWSIPLSQAALVLVDVWDRHYLKDTHARAEEIIQQRLRPLVDRCRAAGRRRLFYPCCRPGLLCAHCRLPADTGV